MTLDEAIKYAEDVAEEKNNDAELFKKVKATDGKILKCLECAEEHRLLAEWLKELKRLREQTRKEPILDKIKAEIEKLNPVDYGSMYSYESHRGARDMKNDILAIIDKYNSESEVV